MLTEITVSTSGLANPHSHLRELPGVVADLVKLAAQGGVVGLGPMPNTQAGLLRAEQVVEYIRNAKKADVKNQITFIPIVMITENTTEKDIEACIEAGIFDAKVYPLNRTTKSHNGVRHYSKILPVVAYCGLVGMRVHFHPEHPRMDIHSRDAEYMFLPIVDMFLNETETTIVWEHGTDSRCIPLWKSMAESDRFYVTLTAHHLATDEDEAFGDVRAVCKPPVKTKLDRIHLCDFVKENHLWVMAGLDDAPHPTEAKHVGADRCVCGAFTLPFGLQLYAHVLFGDTIDRVMFEGFTYINAYDLYSHARPTPGKFRLIRRPFKIPKIYDVGPWIVEPFWAGRTIDWTLEHL